MPERVEIIGPTNERYVEILSPKALELLVSLHEALADRRAQALAARRRRQAELSGGKLLDFLPETAHIRDDAGWRVARPAPGLADRRVEITGPTDKKMTINALNSGANVWLADFEDANTPLWSNMIEGQLNLKDALDRTIDFTSTRASPTRWAPTKPSPRSWCGRAAGTWTRSTSSSTGSARQAASPISRSTWPPARSASSTRARGPTSTCPRWSHTQRRGCGTTRSTSRQDFLGIPRGTIRATALIETIPAAFEMDEILYELREHSAGLNAGRWDYLFSVIKKFRTRGKEFVLPERNAVDDDRAVHARLHRAARADLPQARRVRDGRHGRVHPVAARRRGERGRARQGPRRQDPRGGRRVRRVLGGAPRPGAGVQGGVRLRARRPAQPAGPAAPGGERDGRRPAERGRRRRAR